jgi:hypothetical protein
MIYALFPQCNISMHTLCGKNEQNTLFAVGKSILNRTSNTHVGKLMLDMAAAVMKRRAPTRSKTTRRTKFCGNSSAASTAMVKGA